MGVKRAKLLLVDPQLMFRQGLAALLKNECPFLDIVGEASDGIEALDQMVRLKPDMVITDVQLCDNNRLDLVRAIHDRYPEVKVLVLSDSETEEDLFGALRAGASAYLLKTLGFSQLIESIKLVASGESILSPSLIRKLVKELRTHTKESQTLYALTRREREILQMAALGASNKEIAKQCSVSITTVKAHFRNILGKLEVNNRTGAVAMAAAYGLLEKGVGRQISRVH